MTDLEKPEEAPPDGGPSQAPPPRRRLLRSLLVIGIWGLVTVGIYRLDDLVERFAARNQSARQMKALLDTGARSKTGDAPAAGAADDAAAAAPEPVTVPSSDEAVREHCRKQLEVLLSPGMTREQLHGFALSWTQSEEFGRTLSCQAAATGNAIFCDLNLVDGMREECLTQLLQLTVAASSMGRDWLFTDTDAEECRNTPLKEVCDDFQKAARSGDAANCPAGTFNGFCQALLALDETRCVADGEQKEAFERACRKSIAQKRQVQAFAQGTRNGTKAEELCAAPRSEVVAVCMKWIREAGRWTAGPAVGD